MDEEDRPCNANLVTQLPNLPLLLFFFFFFLSVSLLGQSFPSFTGLKTESPAAETENSAIKSPRLRENYLIVLVIVNISKLL